MARTAGIKNSPWIDDGPEEHWTVREILVWIKRHCGARQCRPALDLYLGGRMPITSDLFRRIQVLTCWADMALKKKRDDAAIAEAIAEELNYPADFVRKTLKEEGVGTSEDHRRHVMRALRDLLVGWEALGAAISVSGLLEEVHKSTAMMAEVNRRIMAMFDETRGEPLDMDKMTKMLNAYSKLLAELEKLSAPLSKVFDPPAPSSLRAKKPILPPPSRR